MLALAVLAAHVAWIATPDPQRPEDFGASPGPCAVYAPPSTPPPPPAPARIEGRVIARDGTPRRDVEVRATMPETARQYTTFTNGDGRFTIAGFDADVDVEVAFWAPTPRMGARCVFRLTRGAPEKKLVVVLDHIEPRLTAPEGDCERWEGGPVKFLSRDEERAIFGAREEPQPVRLDLRARDIAGVTWSRGEPRSGSLGEGDEQAFHETGGGGFRG